MLWGQLYRYLFVWKHMEEWFWNVGVFCVIWYLVSGLPTRIKVVRRCSQKPSWPPSLDPLIAGFWIFLGSSCKRLAEIDRGFRVFFRSDGRGPGGSPRDPLAIRRLKLIDALAHLRRVHCSVS